MKALSSFSYGASAQTLACESCRETFTFFVSNDNPRTLNTPLKYCPRCAHPTLVNQQNTEEAAFTFLAAKYSIDPDFLKALYQMFEQQNKFSRFDDYMQSFIDGMSVNLAELNQSTSNTNPAGS
jgi:hypothetical protein